MVYKAGSLFYTKTYMCLQQSETVHARILQQSQDIQNTITVKQPALSSP